jgi:hypothetical protein
LTACPDLLVLERSSLNLTTPSPQPQTGLSPTELCQTRPKIVYRSAICDEVRGRAEEAEEKKDRRTKKWSGWNGAPRKPLM